MSTSHFSKCWLSSSVFNCERDQLCVSLGIKTLVDSPALLGGPTGPRGQQGPWAVGGLSVLSSTALLDSRRGAPTFLLSLLLLKLSRKKILPLRSYCSKCGESSSFSHDEGHIWDHLVFQADAQFISL